MFLLTESPNPEHIQWLPYLLIVFSALGWKGNRAIFVVIVFNFIALIMIYFNILSLVESWLDALGVLTTSMATIVIVDYYIVRKKMATEGHPSTSENINIAGIATLIISTITSLSLSTANIFFQSHLLPRPYYV